MNKLTNKQTLIHTSKAILMLFIGATLVLWSWNNTLPVIFGLPSIHFKESIGLIVLALSISFIFRQGRHSLRHNEGK